MRDLSELECDIRLYEPSEAIIERMKSERVRLSSARAILLDVLYDMVDYGEFASVFAAEKIVYFLQRLGGKEIFNIQFARNYYGPYSGGKIAHVLYYLNGSYISGMAGLQKRPFESIWMNKDARKDIDEYLASSERSFERALTDKCKDFLRGFYSNYALELLATVDFLLQEDSCFSNWINQDRTIII